MSRDTRDRQASTAPSPLASLLAHSTTPNELLPHLHQHALDVTGGSCSLLFQHNPRTGGLQATSGFGLEGLKTDPWMPGPDETAIVADAFARRVPTMVADAVRQTPDLAARLESRAALLLPLVRRGERVGLLAVGFAHPPAAADVDGNAVEAADAFMTALELFHLRQAEELQRDVRALLEEFTGSLSATLNLAAGLDIFCHGANRLFAADRTSVWIHDRRARQLVLHASSDPADVARGVRVAADDTTAPAAIAMRRARAEIVSPAEDEVTAMVTVPLRGCRRALGTVVFEGVRVETGGEIELLDRADALGRQLSSAVENMQLLDDVMRSRRELENTFDSISHLVAVSDTRGELRFMRYDARHRLITGGALLGQHNAEQRLRPVLAQRLAATFPELASLPGSVQFDYVWNGTIGMTRDDMPHVHMLGPDGYAWVGCNGRAVGLSIAIGREFARGILGAGRADLALPFTEPEPIPFHRIAKHIAPKLALLDARRRDAREV